MIQAIEAVYENGMFKSLTPVALPDGALVRIQAESSADNLEQMIRQRLAQEGTDSAETDRILDNLRLLWSVYDGLTDEQKAILGEARLDQVHFFAHSTTP